MGSHHSAPVLVDGGVSGGRGNEKPKRKPGDRRGKLTKPRTNTNTEPGQCLPFASKLGVLGALSSRRPATAPGSMAAQMDFLPLPLPIPPTPPPREAYRAGRPRPLSQGLYRKESLQEVDDVLQGAVPALSAPLRRRSTLRAAPPATISRKPHVPAPAPVIKIDETPSQEQPPTTLQALDLSPAVNAVDPRSGTPSGYSVLGNFKRGSLRITNGSASPAPSSMPNSPMLAAQFQTEDAPSPSALLAEYINPEDSTRFVSPSPSLYPGCKRLSFEESPSPEWAGEYDHIEPLALPKPTPPNTAITPLERSAVTAASQSPTFHQNRSPYDSGYSSTESTASWCTAYESAANGSRRSFAVAPLEGGLFGSSTMLQESRFFPSPAPSSPQRQRGKSTEECIDGYIDVYPGVSCTSSCSAAAPDALERITGQEYYQRFSRRRNGPLVV